MADWEAGRSLSIANSFQCPGGIPQASMMSEAPMLRGLAIRPELADERLGACARRAMIHWRPSQGREAPNCAIDTREYGGRVRQCARSPGCWRRPRGLPPHGEFHYLCQFECADGHALRLAFGESLTPN